MLKALLGQLFAGKSPKAPAPDERLLQALKKESGGDLPGAEAIYREALTEPTPSADLLALFGSNLLRQGRPAEAVTPLAQAKSLRPDSVEARFLLAGAWGALGRHADAVQEYRALLELRPDFAEAMNNLGQALFASGDVAEAEAWYLKAHALQPALADVAANLGTLYVAEGWIEQALRWYEKAFRLNAALVQAHGNHVFCLNYEAGRSPEQVFEAHREWARVHAEPLRAHIRKHTNDASPERRLRVGYVSSNFVEHPATYFLESTMAGHDPQQVETFCYSDTTGSDVYTRRMKAAAHHWRDSLALDDERFAEQVRADAIDILVDLNGHIKNNRLLAFARKPAPLQVTWSGYPNTTGLSAMDYRLTDGYADPPGMTEHLHSEQLLRMPQVYMAFTPPDGDPPANELPALKNGYVTFGSFNTLSKLSVPVIATWARLMERMPGSRLLVATVGEGRPRERLLDSFAAHGIGPERLELHGRLPRKQFIELHQRADMALDSFPYNGTTTTCHSLWMGLPVIALEGRNHVSRVGVSMLTNVGLPELIARTEDKYIDIAATLAADLPRLAALRASLRERMRRSPLTDGVAFARHLEAGYRDIWRRWCAALRPG